MTKKKKDSTEIQPATSEEKTLAILGAFWDPSPKSRIDPKTTSLRFKLVLIVTLLSALAFWELGVPYLFQEVSYAGQGTSSKEQRAIENFNYTEQEYARLLKTDPESIDEIPFVLELIDHLDKLIKISPNDYSYKEMAAVFHTHIGSITDEDNQALEHLEKAQKIYLNRLSENPDQYNSDSGQNIHQSLAIVGHFISLRNGEEATEESSLTNSVQEHDENSLIISTSGWTEERVAVLEKMWADGHSAREISERLGGVTRNAVIGKVHRLGLSGRSAKHTQ